MGSNPAGRANMKSRHALCMAAFCFGRRALAALALPRV
ncbi:hypothetical protein CC56_1076 [Bordetella pertussis H934]|nr:hypothetical protein CC56_1076 [Bordetella pertussis H934]